MVFLLAIVSCSAPSGKYESLIKVGFQNNYLHPVKVSFKFIEFDDDSALYYVNGNGGIINLNILQNININAHQRLLFPVDSYDRLDDFDLTFSAFIHAFDTLSIMINDTTILYKDSFKEESFHKEEKEVSDNNLTSTTAYTYIYNPLCKLICERKETVH